MSVECVYLANHSRSVAHPGTHPGSGLSADPTAPSGRSYNPRQMASDPIDLAPAVPSAPPPPPHAHYYDCVVCAVCSWARDNVLVRGSIGQRMAALVAVRAGAIPSSAHWRGVFWAINTHFWLYVLKFKEHAHDMQLFEKTAWKRTS